MLDRKLLEQLGSQIPPTFVRDYAKTRGWKPVEGSKCRLWVFRHPDEANLRQLIIPIDRDEDYVDALREVVLRLAEFENHSPEIVLNNLLAANSDVIRFRVGGDGVSAGMLPMVDAAGLIEGARRALLSSACSVINKVTHHARMSLSCADDFLKVCKMGQTEIGSYVVKVVCPLNEMETEGPILQEAQPFAREATKVLMGSCHKIVQSIEQDRVDEMLKNDLKSPEVTSNLCEALLRMHAAREKSDLTLEVSWAAMPKVPIPSISRTVAFKPEYFRTVEEIQRQLRPQKEQEKEALFLGSMKEFVGRF